MLPVLDAIATSVPNASIVHVTRQVFATTNDNRFATAAHAVPQRKHDPPRLSSLARRSFFGVTDYGGALAMTVLSPCLRTHAIVVQQCPGLRPAPTSVVGRKQ